MAETETLVSQSEYARHQGVSHTTVGKWISAGKLGDEGQAYRRRGSRYLINQAKADAMLAMRQKPTAQRFPGNDFQFDGELDPETRQPGTDSLRSGGKGSEYHQATTWRARYEALLKQHEYEVATGLWVKAEDVKTQAFLKARTIRDMLLNLPGRLGPVLAAEDDQEKIHLLLDDEIRLVLEELSK